MRRIEHKVLNDSFFDTFTIDWRLIARNTFRINVTVILAKELKLPEVHVQLYYRYATWQKYLIDVRENACDITDPTKLTPVMSIAYQWVKAANTNFFQRCPYRANQTLYLVSIRNLFLLAIH